MSYLNHNPLESTAFVSLEIKSTPTTKGGWFNLYWTTKAGMYGNQVHFEGNDYSKEDGYFMGKTTGCGYSKESSALNDYLKELIGVAPSCHYSASDLLRAIHKGGNCFVGTRAAIKKAIKLRK